MSAVVTSRLDGRELARALHAGIRRLLSQQEHLDRINVFPVPDGDTGTNLAITLSSVLGVVRGTPVAHAGQTLTRVADAALDGARGNSGAILAQFFLGMGDRAGHLEALTAHDFADALQTGATYARDALAEPREGTILTVLREAAAEAHAAVAHGVQDFVALTKRTLARAHAALDATRDQLDSLRKANVVDAGAAGFVVLLEGVTDYLATGELDESAALPAIAHADEEHAAGAVESLEHRWCTECMITGDAIDRRHLRERLSALGSSLVVAGTSGKVRVHVHVGDPETVFRLAGEYGAVSGQKADDMRRQERAAHHAARRRVAIVTDSAADLPDDELEHLDIHLVPVRVHFGEHSYLDKVSLTAEQFFAMLASSPVAPKTSQPPPGDFRRLFEFLGSHYESVVSVNLTGRASGTRQAAEAAAARANTHERVTVIDSLNASLGQGLLAMYAAECADAGMDAAQVADAVRAMIPRTHTLACLRTLDHAVRGGRVPRAAKVAADWLRVSPLLANFPDGRVGIGGVLWGRSDLTHKFARFVARRLEAAKRWRVMVGHAAAPAEGELLRELLAARANVERTWLLPVGSALSAHGGPGMLAVGFQECVPPR
jgi:DegV family protein with EDD domain